MLAMPSASRWKKNVALYVRMDFAHKIESMREVRETTPHIRAVPCPSMEKKYQPGAVKGKKVKAEKTK